MNNLPRELAPISSAAWSPIAGASVLSMRGGDFELPLGEDLSIGYASHTDAAVRLYLCETLTFFMLTSEASASVARP